VTAEELQRAHLTDPRADLVTGRIIARLDAYLERNPLGRLFTAGPGFTPTISFIKRERLPDPPPATAPDLVPDLMVDVLTPDQRPKEILARITDWLRAGTDVVWVFEPQRSVARIYRREGTEEFIAAEGAMRGEELLPGLSFPLTEVFPPGS